MAADHTLHVLGYLEADLHVRQALVERALYADLLRDAMGIATTLEFPTLGLVVAVAADGALTLTMLPLLQEGDTTP